MVRPVTGSCEERGGRAEGVQVASHSLREPPTRLQHTESPLTSLAVKVLLVLRRWVHLGRVGMANTRSKPAQIERSARTGQFVKTGTEKRQPSTTVTETRKKPKSR